MFFKFFKFIRLFMCPALNHPPDQNSITGSDQLKCFPICVSYSTSIFYNIFLTLHNLQPQFGMALIESGQ